MKQNGVCGFNRVKVYLDGVGPVFFSKALSYSCCWQLSGLTGHNEAGIQSARKNGAHDVATSFKADNLGYSFVFIDLIEHLFHYLKCLGIFEESCYVTKVNSLLGEVGDAA